MRCLAISQEFYTFFSSSIFSLFNCSIRELRMKRILSKKRLCTRMRRRLLCDAGNDLELDLHGPSCFHSHVPHSYQKWWWEKGDYYQHSLPDCDAYVPLVPEPGQPTKTKSGSWTGPCCLHSSTSFLKWQNSQNMRNCLIDIDIDIFRIALSISIFSKITISISIFFKSVDIR